MANKICGIYCIENLINGKKYIGLSVNIKRRFYEHRSDLNADKHYNSHLQNAWNTYGKDNFKFYVVEECSPDMLSERERYYIKFFDLNNPSFGYNADPGGKSTTEEVRKKLSEAAKKNIWTEDRKIALSEKMSGENNPSYGRHHTDEEKKKMKENRKDTHGINNPMYGKKHSDKAKQKIGEAKKGKHPSEETREKLRARTGEKSSRHIPVYCPELDRTFWGPTEVEQERITKQSYVSACLIGNQKTAGKHPVTGEPLHWFYAKEYFNDTAI